MSRYEEWTDRELIEELDDRDSDLTRWEVDFLESVLQQSAKQNRQLTTKQRTKLIEILRRVDDEW